MISGLCIVKDLVPLSPAELNELRSRLINRERVHTFACEFLFLAGCDVDTARILEFIDRRGAWFADDDSRFLSLGHDVIVLDDMGCAIAVEVLPKGVGLVTLDLSAD